MSEERATTLALLGPTNTGKTHQAIERMLEHPSGMIGLPLRLLAREVYDRITARIGEREVALVTGEEKRIPPRARFWICTVEAMPSDNEVSFLAVDEIQLAAHAQRGHVFTERMQFARGTSETWFLGSRSAENLLSALVPTAKVRGHPRLSQLKSAGQSTLALLPKRSAVVAFSAERVYELAEKIRQKHGGAAVVLGALSPRARNAQVALYQAGEVDYLVATDAIGMGLNLDIQHVAFSGLHKFDGTEVRPLEPAELGQIAGRAGRYLNDGTFGTLAPLGPMPEGLAQSIENHRFADERFAWWRNTELDFSSIDALVESLSVRPRARYLKLMDQADDFEALKALAARDEIRKRASGTERIELLWDVCRIPDYRGLFLEYHAGLLSELYLQLCGPSGRLEPDWVADQIARLNDTEGDIDTLLTRMAFIRTWTYVSYQSNWLADARSWQDETQLIEDRLSDALHERLVSKFVDRSLKQRRALSQKKTRQAAAKEEPASEPAASGNPFSQLMGLREELARKQPALASDADTDDQVEALVNARHERFVVDDRGRISLDGIPIARFSRGTDLLRPTVSIALSDLGAGARSRVQRRLLAFARDFVSELFGPLEADELKSLSAAGRGLVYQLEHGLGTIWTAKAAPQIAALSAEDRRLLEKAGVQLGKRVIYIRALGDAAALIRRSALWHAYTGERREPSDSRAPSLPVGHGLSPAGYLALGYAVFGSLALRADVVDRVAKVLRNASRRGTFRPPRVLARKLGCSEQALPALIRAFGYVSREGGRFAKPREDQQKTATP